MVFFFSSRRRHTRCGRDWSSDVCSSDLLAEMMRVVRLRDGPGESLGREHIFAAQEDVGDVSLDGERRDNHAFDELMRILLHQEPVLKGSRLHFIGIADEIRRVRYILSERNE